MIFQKISMLQFIGPVLKLSTVELVDSKQIGKRTRISDFPGFFFSCLDLRKTTTSMSVPGEDVLKEAC